MIMIFIRNRVLEPFKSKYKYSKYFTSYAKNNVHLTNAELDKIEKNISLRQHSNNLPLIKRLLQEIETNSDLNLRKQLENERLKLPNETHPRIAMYGTQPVQIMEYTSSRTFRSAMPFSDIAKRLNLCRMEHLGNYTGHKSYYLTGSLSLLENALISYAFDYLIRNQFKFISVPDVLPKHIIEACGMQTDGDRSQIYKIDNDECLSGTSEMALAGYFIDTKFKISTLPLKMCSFSRCYRAETSSLQEEKGIYRVHQFNKVEMFALAEESRSEEILESFRDIEMQLYRSLNINYKVLDMPPFELGAPAYQKYDIEAWMPARFLWGEVSSCSNCTDYQAKRLNIKYIDNVGNERFMHTINGTAVAIPRLLIALLESNQIDRNTLHVPECLQSYLKCTTIEKQKRIPELKLNKGLKQK